MLIDQKPHTRCLRRPSGLRHRKLDRWRDVVESLDMPTSSTCAYNTGLPWDSLAYSQHPHVCIGRCERKRRSVRLMHCATNRQIPRPASAQGRVCGLRTQDKAQLCSSGGIRAPTFSPNPCAVPRPMCIRACRHRGPRPTMGPIGPRPCRSQPLRDHHADSDRATFRSVEKHQ